MNAPSPPPCLSSVIGEAWEGGGMLGHAYGPVIEGFDTYHLPIIHHAGTSAGAITALLRALCYSASRIRELQEQTDWHKWALYRPPATVRLVRDRGWFPNTAPHSWIKERIEEAGFKSDLTFRQLWSYTGHKLYVVATRWEGYGASIGASPVVFSESTTPDTLVLSAVLASMSVPLFWPLVEIDGWWYCDGGMLINHPLGVLVDPTLAGLSHEQVIGVRLDTSTDIQRATGALKPVPVKPSLGQLIVGSGTLLHEAANTAHMPQDLWDRVIRIDVTGERALDFRVKPAAIQRLRAAGETAIREWVSVSVEIT